MLCSGNSLFIPIIRLRFYSEMKIHLFIGVELLIFRDLNMLRDLKSG